MREAGIPFTPFEAQGFNRNHPLTLPKAVLTIQKSTTLARRWFDEIQPDAVVGFGGYVCIPVARAAEQRGIPVVVHEQNMKHLLERLRFQYRKDSMFQNLGLREFHQ